MTQSKWGFEIPKVSEVFVTDERAKPIAWSSPLKAISHCIANVTEALDLKFVYAIPLVISCFPLEVDVLLAVNDTQRL